MLILKLIVDRLKGARESLRALVRRDAVEREMSDELAFHVEMETEKNVRAGLSEEEARRQALLSFRGVERYKEEVRASRRTRGLEVLGEDVRAALRSIGRAPGLAAVVVLTLGLGIGASTVIFSVVDTAVLRPLPWPDPGSLVLVREVTPRGAPFTVSAPNYLDFRESGALEGLAAFRDAQPSLMADGRPERLKGVAATHTLFPLLGVRAAIGRTYGAEEDTPGGDTRVAVLSHGLWEGRFGGDTAVVGGSITLDGESYRVTGVLPADFSFFDAEIWTPLAPDPAGDRTNHWLDVVGRLPAGVSREAAEARLSRTSESLGEVHPAMRGWGVEVRGMSDWIVGPDFRRASAVLAGAVGLLLLLACANAANLLLARATARDGDMAVRSALGAGRGRLMRQLLTESGVLAMAGAALGTLAAVWTVGLIRGAAPPAIPRVAELTVDLRVLGFAALVALATALLAGIAPALQAARADAGERLRSGGRHGASRGQRRLRDALVVAQVAVAVVLLLGSGLMLRSFVRLQSVDPGFETEGIWAAPLQLPSSRYPGSDQAFFAFRDIVEAIEGVPGVTSVAGNFADPFSGFNTVNDVTPAERAAEFGETGFLQAAWRSVTPGYFETMGVPLLRGRLFTPEDRYGAPPTVIVTRTLAERLWPGQDAVGKRMYWGGTDGEPRTVVGVVGDVQDVALDADPPPLMFLSYRQLGVPMMTMLIRAEGDPASLPDAVRQAVWSVDPELPVPEVVPLTRRRAASMAAPRFNTIVLTAFAAVSLALAAIGIYGLLGFIVARRTREIGLRRALGAGSGNVSGQVIRRALILSSIGVAAGLVAAIALTRTLEELLFRTAGTDPVTFLAVPALFALVTGLAAWIPARRAAAVSPMVALRAE